MPFVTIASEQIYFIERGQGLPVVFIHGAGSSHLIWGAQVAALATSAETSALGEVARAIAFDLPGHNKSPGAGRDSIDAYRDLLLAFLDTLRIERAVLAGHSMGGAIVQSFALAHPDRVIALALIDTGARLRVLPALLDAESPNFAEVLRKVTQESFAAGADTLLVQKAEAQLLACDPHVVRGDYAACNAFDVIDRIGEIRAPTLVVCGTEDRMTPRKYSEFLASKIPSARLEMIEKAGHQVMIEQPDAVNGALSAFVRLIQVG